jgi:hypothetical protein
MAAQFTPVEGNPFDKKKEKVNAPLEQSFQPTFSGNEPQEMDQELTLGRVGQLLSRGAVPAVTGAVAGGTVGGAGGALLGATALPIGDALNTLYNAAANLISTDPKYKLAMPSQIVSQWMEQSGLGKEPTTPSERVIEATGSGVAGAGAQVKALQGLSKTATTELGRNIASKAAEAPLSQIAVSAPASAVAQTVTEATGNPILGMVAGGTVGAVGGARTRKVESAPGAQELKDAASLAYKRSADAGAVIKPESLQNAGQKIIEKVSNKIQIDPETDTEAMAVVRRLSKVYEQPQTLEQLDLTRQFIRGSIKGDDRSSTFAKQALKEFDNYINSIDQKDILAGDSKTAIDSLNTARGLWKQSQKVALLDDLLQSADVRAGANYSQSGMENALRRKLVNLADSEDLKFFSKGEQDAIRAAAKGGNLQNFLRWAGKLSPTSVIAGAGGSYLGASLFGAPGAVIAPVLGAGSKMAATKIGLDNFADLQKMMALGRMPEAQPRTRLMGITGIRGLLSSPEERQRLIDEETNLGQ